MVTVDRQSEGENYSKQETQRRVEAALRGARIAGHREMKDLPRKRKPQLVAKAGKKAKH